MYSTQRLHETFGAEGLPFMLALATPTHVDIDAIISRADGLTYCPETQRNIGGDVSMGRSTCNRRDSTGLIFLDNDRQQDD